jgi:cytoplasmic iron level regulating protein YaaA (DUF328/UPF0246 family)
MLLVLSPAKSLDLTPAPELPATKPRFLKDTTELAAVARKLSPGDLAELMDISDRLAELNRERFRSFKPRAASGVQAALAFAGDVYRGLDARSLDADALAWAQDHVRILSGLYGVLRPLDAIQPYRLEMGVSLRTDRGSTLYDFWGDRIAKALNADGRALAEPTLINLASQEYFGAVDARALKLRRITVVFKEEQNGEARVLAFFAKKARGMMARYAIDHRIEHAEGLKAFDTAGYSFRPEASNDAEWVFARPQPPPAA